jgi:cysteine synthase B
MTPNVGLPAAGPRERAALDPTRESGRPAPGAGRPADSSSPALVARRPHVLETLVGNTPLVELPSWGPAGVGLFGKAEYANPGGSVKDRAALRIIQEAETAGLLGPGRVLLDSSSGNTGIAYAMLCAARGYAVEICIPRNASAERKQLLRAYGARVVETDPLEGADGAAREARRRVAERPDLYFFADQYNNSANWRAHYHTTAEEIWRQTEGRISHWVAGLGTSGTFTGTARRLLELNPQVRLIACQPDAPFHGLEGWKHMATSSVPGIYDPTLADEIVDVGTEESQAMARRLAREAGLLVGVSAAANVVAAMRVAARLSQGLVVTVLPDGGDRYLEHSFWNEG